MRRGQQGRTGVVFAIIAIVVLLAVVGGGSVLYGRTELEPPASAAGAKATIAVRSGESLDTLVKDLAAHGIIRSAFWFGWYARLQGLASRLLPGTYVFDDAMSASYIIQRLEAPAAVSPRHLLLAEGLTASQMAQKIAAAGIGISAAQYLQEVEKGSFSEPFLSARPAGASLEGFLFPDTYDIPQHATAHDVVQLQLADFARKGMPLLAGLTPQQLYATLTVASITEREAQFQSDRAQVAGVVDNRLARGMRLQLDSTVIYGLGLNGATKLSAQQLATDTPYNTYLHAGLPPTPISNPGASNITAAVHPTPSPYLFFISDCSGHNHYSVTIKEHEKNIALYLGKPCGT